MYLAAFLQGGDVDSVISPYVSCMLPASLPIQRKLVYWVILFAGINYLKYPLHSARLICVQVFQGFGHEIRGRRVFDFYSWGPLSLFTPLEGVVLSLPFLTFSLRHYLTDLLQLLFLQGNNPLGQCEL